MERSKKRSLDKTDLMKLIFASLGFFVFIASLVLVFKSKVDIAFWLLLTGVVSWAIWLVLYSRDLR